MAVTTDAVSGKQKIDISQLDIVQLNQLQQQIDQEVEFLTTSINQLMSIRAKFHNSLENVDKLQKAEETSAAADTQASRPSLIPLSGSMYVNGEVTDYSTVIVEIGTGYFAEKSAGDAKEYFERRVSYVNKQLQKLEPTYQEKQKMKHLVTEMLQYKFQSALASQQAAAGTAGASGQAKSAK